MYHPAPPRHAAPRGNLHLSTSARASVWPALAAGLIWLMLGLGAGYWVLLALGRPASVAPLMASASLVSVQGDDVAHALGGKAPLRGTAEAHPPAGHRYALLGVVAVGTDKGAALISVDGQAAKPYRVGASIDGNVVLLAVGARSARLGSAQQGPVSQELVLPARP